MSNQHNTTKEITTTSTTIWIELGGEIDDFLCEKDIDNCPLLI